MHHAVPSNGSGLSVRDQPNRIALGPPLSEQALELLTISAYSQRWEIGSHCTCGSVVLHAVLANTDMPADANSCERLLRSQAETSPFTNSRYWAGPIAPVVSGGSGELTSLAASPGARSPLYTPARGEEPV